LSSNKDSKADWESDSVSMASMWISMHVTWFTVTSTVSPGNRLSSQSGGVVVGLDAKCVPTRLGRTAPVRVHSLCGVKTIRASGLSATNVSLMWIKFKPKFATADQ